MKKEILVAILSLMALGYNPVLAKEKASGQDMFAEVSASTTGLSGVVLDKATHESLAGVSIYVNGRKVYTDLDGKFEVKDLCNGTCELKVSLISYEDQLLTIDTQRQKSLKIQLNQR